MWSLITYSKDLYYFEAKADAAVDTGTRHFMSNSFEDLNECFLFFFFPFLIVDNPLTL